MANLCCCAPRKLDSGELQGEDNVSMHTVAEAAQLLDLAPRTVRKWCAILCIEKHGRDYLIADRDLERIRKQNHQPGRPNTEKG